ncbi:MAG: hypothetical protein ACE5KR_01015 [Candidatus Bipolaricaulia bacterium]
MYSLSLGTIYLGMGLLEALGRYSKFIPHDIFGGFVLLVIGGIYLSGTKSLWRRQNEGLAGLLVGTALTLIFASLYLLVMGADGLSYLLGDLEEWRPLADLRPEVWLAPLALPGLWLIRIMRMERGTKNSSPGAA